MCGPEGLWDGKFRKCPTAGHCDRPKNIASVTFACGNLEPGSKCKAKCNKKGFEAAIRVREWFNEISMGWFTLESKVHSMHTLTQSELELTL